MEKPAPFWLKEPKPAPRAAPSAVWRYARALVLIAVVAAGIVWATRTTTKRVRDFTAAEIQAKMEDDTQPVEEALPIDLAITQVNRLTPEERRELMQSPAAQRYFQKLPPEKRFTFVKGTLDKGLVQQIEHFRALKGAERDAFIDEIKGRQKEARERWDSLSAEEREKMREFLNTSNIEVVVEKAVQSYLSVTTSAERAELAPLFDGAFSNLEYIRRSRR